MRQLTVMRPRLDQLALAAWYHPQPIRELNGQQFTKQMAHTDARVEIPAPPRRVVRAFIVSKIGTVKGQLHEAREGDASPLADFVLNNAA